MKYENRNGNDASECDLEPMFERQELFPVAQVPLAHQLGPVPGGGQHLGEEELPVGDPTHHLLRGVRVPPRVGGLVEPIPQGQPGTGGLINLETESSVFLMLRPARQQRCSGGGADGSAGVELGEEDALSRHPDGGQ